MQWIFAKNNNCNMQWGFDKSLCNEMSYWMKNKNSVKFIAKKCMKTFKNLKTQ